MLTFPITASAASGDYTAIASEARTFPAGSVNGAQQCWDVTVSTDGFKEGSETFTASVVLTTPGLGVALGSATSAEVTITDIDCTCYV